MGPPPASASRADAVDPSEDLKAPDPVELRPLSGKLPSEIRSRELYLGSASDRLPSDVWQSWGCSTARPLSCKEALRDGVPGSFQTNRKASPTFLLGAPP